MQGRSGPASARDPHFVALPYGARMIGRLREVDCAAPLLNSVMRSGAHALLVEGEAGIGKSRLIDELLPLFNTNADRVVRVSAKPDAPQFQLCHDLVHALSGLPGNPQPGQHRRRHPHDAAKPATAGEARLSTATEWVSRLLKPCHVGLSIVVVDDLHWADDRSLEVLELLVEDLQGTELATPLLLTLAYRPLEGGSAARALSNRVRQWSRAQHFLLAPLEEADRLDAIEALGVTKPSPTYQTVVSRASHGNPLLLRAAVELLQRRGVPADLRPDDRRALGTPQLGELLANPVRAWLDGLSSDCMAVLGCAAIYGGEVTLAEAVQLAGQDAASVAGALDEALAAHVMETDDVLFWFAHPLLLEESHRSLGTARRPVARSIGAQLASASGFAARAAEHALRAAELISPQQRLVYYLAGAQQAEADGAWDVAARLRESALGVTTTPSGELHFCTGEAHYFNHDPANAIRHLERAVELGEQTHDEPLWSRAAILLVRARNTTETSGLSGSDHAAPLHRFIDNAVDPTLRVLALELAAQVAAQGGNVAEALEFAARAIAAARETSDKRARALAFVASGFAHLANLDLDIAQQHYQRSLDLARSVEDRWLISAALSRLPFVCAASGRLEEAGSWASEAAEVALTGRQFASESFAAAMLSQIALLRGDFAAAQRHGERGRKAAHRAAQPMALLVLYPTLIRCGLVQDDIEGAVAALEDWRALAPEMAPIQRRYADLLEATKLRRGPGPSRRFSGAPSQLAAGFAAVEVETALQRGHTAGLEQAQAMLGACADKGLVYPANWPVAIARVLGDLAAAQGDSERAEASYLRALDQFSGDAHALEQASTHLGLATLAHDAGNYVRSSPRGHAAAAHRLGLLLQLPAVSRPAGALVRRAIEPDVATATNSLVHGLGGQPSTPRLAILVTDIVASTKLSVELGDLAYHTIVSEHHGLVRGCLGRFRGQEFSEGGDSLLAWFASAAAALACGQAIQDELLLRASAGRRPLMVRVGIAAGEPLFTEGRPYGAAVALAVRVVGEAEGGEVLATEVVVRWAGGSHSFGPPRHRQLKGFPGVHNLRALRGVETTVSGSL